MPRLNITVKRNGLAIPLWAKSRSLIGTQSTAQETRGSSLQSLNPQTDPMFDDVRNTQHFRTLLERVGLGETLKPGLH
jgi:hypothetical protein